MARTVHCTVVEVPAMSDPLLPRPRGFRDLVPWADPYITGLLEKLSRQADLEDDLARDVSAELPPPLDKDEPGEAWQADWSPRNWPRA